MMKKKMKKSWALKSKMNQVRESFSSRVQFLSPCSHSGLATSRTTISVKYQMKGGQMVRKKSVASVPSAKTVHTNSPSSFK